MNEVTTVYTVLSSFVESMNNCHEIENRHPISIPHIEGNNISYGSNSYICKIIEEDAALIPYNNNNNNQAF
jgi:hypothetical protein